MLRPDPAQAVRLAEISAKLRDRIREATDRGWLGEVEGLQVSLAGARQKYQQIRRANTISEIRIDHVRTLQGVSAVRRPGRPVP